MYEMEADCKNVEPFHLSFFVVFGLFLCISRGKVYKLIDYPESAQSIREVCGSDIVVKTIIGKRCMWDPTAELFVRLIIRSILEQNGLSCIQPV